VVLTDAGFTHMHKYNTELCTRYINVWTCIHTHWKPLNPPCSWSGYRPGCTRVNFPQTLYRSVTGSSLFCVKQTQTLNSEDLFYIIFKYLCTLRSFFNDTAHSLTKWIQCVISIEKKRPRVFYSRVRRNIFGL